MASNLANGPSGLDPLTQPFRLLGIDPAATAVEIEAALAQARAKRMAPETRLAEACANILDPVRRLRSELSCPLDSTADCIDQFYAEPVHGSEEAILQASVGFPPISKANFLARHAAREAASSELLVALMDAHNSIDVMRVYQILQALRHRARWPSPSLISVRDGISELLDTHCTAAMAAYHPVEGAAGPLLEATGRILATGDRPLIETHSLLLAAYRRATMEARSEADRQIDTICLSLGQSPDDTSMIQELDAALTHWASLCGPLLLTLPRESDAPEMNVAPDRIFLLLSELGKQGHYRAAQRVLEHALDTFRSIPSASARLAEAGEILRDLLAADANHVDPGEVPAASSEADAAVPAPVGKVRLRGVAKTLVAVTALLAFAAITYLTFDSGSSLPVASAPNPLQSNAEPELLPPIGKGQRLAREYVRYCHFQEERLRVIKQQLRGPEDIRAYNALASDYNSRCSDFFYQDEDLRAVKEEVTAKRKLLETDAGRILSTWPSRASADRTPAPK